MAAAAGNAPALPVSETGVQTSTLSGKMVAREGAAPPISGCRPDVILFHHRAETGCRGWTRTTTLAFKGRCPAIRRPGKKLVEPEVVATSPYPIKSRVPVCCGFSSTKMVGERGLAPPRLTDSRSVGSAIPSEPLARNWCSRPESHRQPQPSEGCALIIELQEQKKWSLLPVLPRRDFLTKEACRLPQGGEMVAVSSAALDTAGL